jgi:4-amino-4-deoxy-L-arabinose transferase-like glycosyltransferase
MINWNRKDSMIAAALTILAAALRLYGLGSVPPGFQFDEAFNAIDAQQVLEGNRPLFLPANAGREALYTYWQALLVSFFGMNVFTLRLSSALFGILAVPVTYVLLRVLLRRNSRSVSLFTSLVLATSLWHIHFSHFGIRVIMMPVVFSAAFGTFWLGNHAQRRQTQIAAYIVSGLFIGLSVWTHPTGRLAPFVVLLYTLWLLWQDSDARRLALTGPIGGLLLSGTVAFLVFLPLGLEFARHPEFFFGHASEVSVFAERVSGGSPLVTLGSNTLRVFGMFAISGDHGWTHNLAGRPVFDLLMALAFAAGLVIWATRIARSVRANTGDEPDADALVLLAAWAAVMLLPSVFSEAAPNYSRTLPALPALFLAAGLGLTWVATIDRPFRYAGVAVATLIVVYSGMRSTYDYFVVFPAQEEVYYSYDADKLDALEYLAEFTDQNHVYLSQLWGNHHATVSMLRGELGIKSLDTSDTLVLPPKGKGAIYAFPSEQSKRAEQLAALWLGVEARPVLDKHGKVLLHLVEVPPELASTPPSKYASLDLTSWANMPLILTSKSHYCGQQMRTWMSV